MRKGKQITLRVRRETVATLRRVAEDLELVAGTGNQLGQGNLSALLDYLAERVESGHLRAGDLAQSRLITNNEGRHG